MTVACSQRGERRRRSRPEILRAGARVGAWRVDGELGRGGMATVYAVTHTRFGKRAALKLAHATSLTEQFTPDAFLREARIVHAVNHAGVPDVFATGSCGGRPYLVMERLAGRTLADLAPGRADAIEILRELCDVLGAAHAAGVVHRDLKLANVFVVEEPFSGHRRVKLIDWGVAHVDGDVDPLTGMIAGTLTYVAPEQIRGEALTAKTDVYSLGVLAYELLCGAAPFTANDDLELLRKHLREDPPNPHAKWPSMPQRLADTLVAMLAKEPEDRPTLAEIAEVLVASRAKPPVPRIRLASGTMNPLPAVSAAPTSIIDDPSIEIVMEPDHDAAPDVLGRPRLALPELGWLGPVVAAALLCVAIALSV